LALGRGRILYQALPVTPPGEESLEVLQVLGGEYRERSTWIYLRETSPWVDFRATLRSTFGVLRSTSV
jgi:hypothetical protein